MARRTSNAVTGRRPRSDAGRPSAGRRTRVALLPRRAQPRRSLALMRSDLCASTVAGSRYGLTVASRVVSLVRRLGLATTASSVGSQPCSPPRRAIGQSRKSVTSGMGGPPAGSRLLTHLPQIGKARHRVIRYRAFSCPSWARTRTLLIQSRQHNPPNSSNLQPFTRARVTRCWSLLK
jgi:hypothetical protein